MPPSSSAPAATRSRRNLFGLAAVAAAGLGFAVLLVLVRTRWAPLESLDRGVATDLNAAVAPHPVVVRILDVVTTLGSNAVLWWLVALAAILLLSRRRIRLAVYVAVAGAGALILDPTLKAAVGRLRPVVADPVAHGQGNSFPSGHALGSLVVYGALLLVFLPGVPARARRAVSAAVAVLVLLIGVSRILLGVHYLSDVVGAWFLGVAWLGLTAYAFELYRHRSGETVPRPLEQGLDPAAARDLAPTGPAVPARGVPRQCGAGRTVAGVVVGWILVFGVVVGFGELVVRFGGDNLLGDHTIPHFLAAHRTPGLNSFSSFWSEAGNTHAIMAVGLVVGAVALGVIRRWRPVVFLVTLMLGELGLFLVPALIIGRDRPDVPHLDQHLPTSSYPSGHVAATLCLYAALVLLVVPRTRRWWRWLTLVPAIAMPVLVAGSRMYRGMHHPTDVTGSLLLAAGWVAVLYLLLQPHRDLRDGTGPARAAVPPAGHGRGEPGSRFPTTRGTVLDQSGAVGCEAPTVPGESGAAGAASGQTSTLLSSPDPQQQRPHGAGHAPQVM